jgi:hypothetical protein
MLLTLLAPAAAPPTGTIVWLRVSGTWKTTTPYTRIAGTWRVATPYTRIAGTWR